MFIEDIKWKGTNTWYLDRNRSADGVPTRQLIHRYPELGGPINLR